MFSKLLHYRITLNKNTGISDALEEKCNSNRGEFHFDSDDKGHLNVLNAIQSEYSASAVELKFPSPIPLLASLKMTSYDWTSVKVMYIMHEEADLTH